jgi:hypothetical protein
MARTQAVIDPTASISNAILLSTVAAVILGFSLAAHCSHAGRAWREA